jgi:dolichol-phosphate mannosyltransferase
LSKITQVKIEKDAGDFRLMSRRVVDTLISLPETTKVFRFLVSSLGFQSATIYFHAPQRIHGKSKYKISHLVKLAVGSIIGFSTAPLSAIFMSGLIIFMSAVIYIIYLIINMNAGQVVPGWTSVMVALIGFSAIQIISLGIIGRYVGQILVELRKRPRYIKRDVNTR